MASPYWFSWICGRGFSLESACTQRSLIDFINVLLLIAHSFGVLSASFRKQHARRRNRHHWFFIAISVCCAAAGVAYIISGFWGISSGRKKRVWEVVASFLRGLIWIAITTSLYIQPTRLVRIIAVLWWTLFSFLISAHNLEVLVRTHHLEILEVIAWPINFLLLFCALSSTLRRSNNQDLLYDNLSQPLLANKTVKNSDPCRASQFSRLTFSWLNPLLRLGWSKPLVLSDIPLIDPENGALQALQKFSEVRNSYRAEKEKGQSNLVFFVLGKCYLKDILLTGFYSFLRAVSIALSPVLLFAFIWYSEQQERNVYTGLLLVGCLIVTKVVECLSQRHWIFESRRTGMRMRSALMAAIFQKQLKLSSQGRRKHSTGEVINYIAVDAYRFGDVLCWFHMAWSLPLNLIFSIFILFWALGLGTLPGLVPLVIFGFFNIPFVKILQGYQAKFMVAQDERLRATSEVLNNMKTIKLQSWEEKFRQMILSLREHELHWLAETQLKKAYGAALYSMSPTIVSAVMFGATAAMGTAPFNATTLFTALAALRVMAEPVRMLPEIIVMMNQYRESLARIEVFLLEDEIKEGDVKKIPSTNTDLGIRVQDGNFSWDPTGADLTLKNVNLSIHRGEKVAICGPVGAGKSSLLHSLLGEIPRISGSVEVFGSVAYVSQNSWIQSGTIRDNILFGKPFDKEIYERAIKCCALDKDIENFDHGNLTEIGRRGLNISGGQKQRIQLARAVYNDADTYILDDPFSAVDAHTAAVLFYDCVMTALRKKTVILVTHQVEFLTETDRILVMEDGRVTQEGTYEELLKSRTAFEQLVNAHKSSVATLDSVHDQSQVPGQQRSEENMLPNGLQDTRKNGDGEISVKGLSAIQLTEEEEKETGDLGWKPYKDYLQVSKGSFLLYLVIFAQTSFTILQILTAYWLAVTVQMHHFSRGLLVGVYSVLSTISCLFAYLRSFFTTHLGLRASNAFFTGFMDSVFNAPMSLFDSTPVGRILTRASSDLSILDFDIPYSIAFVVTGFIDVMTTIIVMSTVTWQVLVVAIPSTIILIYIQRYYVTSDRELVRINGTTKAPVVSYAAESILGVVTIRAFAATERFIRTGLQLIDADATLFFYTAASLEWVLIRVEALQSLTILTSALSLILLPPGAIAPGFASLCLSYALTLTSTQVFLTNFYSSLENYIISVERIKQYMHMPSEPPAIVPESRAPPSWPPEGTVELRDLKVKYRQNAPLVLRGISCTFAAGSKIGVVGRTGSGKSTLVSALFRLIDPAGGKILIDNMDICSIGIRDLRTKLSIIPQEPTLFRGTVRSNLDPLGVHTDQEIWEALEKCQLKSTISSSPALLDSAVSNDGDNWSVGQCQLFCLGRVLLRKNKILVLDEATASIDAATDAVLQTVIKQEFSSCTVITIAHRVPTVTDSDMVMVLSYGKLLEYDKPYKLMEDKQSAFSKLVAEYWSHCKRNLA